jgi:hypothetical protein
MYYTMPSNSSYPSTEKTVELKELAVKYGRER